MSQAFFRHFWLTMLAMLLATSAEGRAEWQNALAPTGATGPSLLLATDGKSDYVIVIPVEATHQDRKAAAELVTWFHEMTGAWLPTVLDSQVPIETEISLGNTNRVAAAGVIFDAASLGDEGYAIDVKGSRLFLNGGAKRGPIYAVFALLEEDLGCRWYTRDSAVIPHRPTLEVAPVIRQYTPELYVRDPFYYEAFNADWSLRNRTNSPRMREDTEQYASYDAPAVLPIWGGRPVYAPGFVHTFATILPASEYFESHPEYYALIDGQRTDKQLCMTSAGAADEVIVRMKRLLAEKPFTTILEISQNDSRAYCKCDECERLTKENNSAAGPQIYFVNKIADAIADSHPHVLVSTLAYFSTLDAPTNIRPSPNVTIRLCNDRQSWRLPFMDFVNNDLPPSREYREAIVAWSKLCNQLTIWEYTVNFGHYLAPLPNMHTLKPNLEFYLAHNVKGMMYQGAYQSPGGERARMRAWVMAKLLWDPSRDVKALTKDFVEGYFGPSAGPILKYYELLDDARVATESIYGDPSEESPGLWYEMDSGLFSPEFLTTATALFEEADALAQTDEMRRRVELEGLPIIYVKLMLGPDAAGNEFAALLSQFERIARQEKIDMLAEGHDGGRELEDRLQYWRNQLVDSRSAVR